MNGGWDDPFWFPDKVTVRASRGGGGNGPRHADVLQLRAEVIDKTELIRDANGVETISTTRVTVPIDSDVPVGSLVTIRPGRPNAREVLVLQVAIAEDAAPLPSHIVLWLK